jgi:hypothetical protein
LTAPAWYRFADHAQPQRQRVDGLKHRQAYPLLGFLQIVCDIIAAQITPQPTAWCTTLTAITRMESSATRMKRPVRSDSLEQLICTCCD